MSEKPESDKITHIVEAARKRFAHFGVAKTTMNEIAADVGLSKASLYYYFPDKEHLFMEVIKHEMENFFLRMKEVTHQPLSASEQIRQYVDLRFTCFQQFVNLSQLGSDQLQAVKTAFANLRTEFVRREKEIMEHILEAGVASNAFETMDVAMQADLFVSVLKSLRFTILKQRDNFALTDEDYESLKTYQTQFANVYIKGISKATSQ